MQWMLSHQKARRNLTAGESLHANQMIMEEIELENKQKTLEGASMEQVLQIAKRLATTWTQGEMSVIVQQIPVNSLQKCLVSV